jgi:hypothetical protein
MGYRCTSCGESLSGLFQLAQEPDTRIRGFDQHEGVTRERAAFSFTRLWIEAPLDQELNPTATPGSLVVKFTLNAAA